MNSSYHLWAPSSGKTREFIRWLAHCALGILSEVLSAVHRHKIDMILYFTCYGLERKEQSSHRSVIVFVIKGCFSFTYMLCKHTCYSKGNNTLLYYI